MNDMLNPYIAGAPVVETSMFFGREDVFNWIERSLAGKYVDHILVLHGQRRVGKTSVLKQIPNFLPDKYIQVFFDLQGRTGTTLDRFLWWLASEIVRTLRREHNINIPKPDRKAFEDTEYLINEFLPGLRSMLGDKVLLLTFDEFDSLDRTEIRETLSRPLIAYLRRLIEAEGLNFIFSIGSSGDKLENMQASYTDFFKSALYRKISFLTRDDCHRLITKPVEGLIKYEQDAVGRISEITSGHPYFTQLMCHELFSRCQKTGGRTNSAGDVEAVLEDVVERGTVNLKFVWDEASDLEKWILATLAQMEGGSNQKLAQVLTTQRVRFSEPDLNSAVIHLRDKDVITKDNRFVIHLMRLWLVTNRTTDRVREELAEVNPIANRYIEIGDEYRDRGQTMQAIESYQQALNVNPGNLKAQTNIASVHLDQKEYGEAAVAFELALKINPEDVAAQTGYCESNRTLGDLARAKKDFDGAIDYYRQVLKINPDHADASQQLKEIQKIVSDYEEAQQAIREKRYERAVELLQGIIVIDPTYKATTRLLTEAVEARKAVPLWRRKWVLPGIVALVVVGLGIFFGPRAWVAVSTAIPNSLTAATELPVSAASTSTLETSADNNATEPVPSEAVKGTEDSDLLADDTIPEIESDRLIRKINLRGWEDSVTNVGWATSGIHLVTTSPVTTGPNPGRYGANVHYIPDLNLSDEFYGGGLDEQSKAVTWFPNELWVTIGSNQGRIATYDVTKHWSDPNHHNPVNSLADLVGLGSIRELQYTGDGNLLVAGTDQGYLGVWQRIQQDRFSRVFKDKIDSVVYTVDWNPNGSSFLTVGKDNGLQIWGTNPVAAQTQLDYTSNTADWSPDGNHIAIASNNMQDGQLFLEVITPGGTSIVRGQIEAIIHKVAWSPENTLIATAGGDGCILLWAGFESGSLEPVLQIDLEASVLDIAWSPDGSMLAAGDAGANIWVWNMDGLDFSLEAN